MPSTKTNGRASALREGLKLLRGRRDALQFRIRTKSEGLQFLNEDPEAETRRALDAVAAALVRARRTVSEAREGVAAAGLPSKPAAWMALRRARDAEAALSARRVEDEAEARRRAILAVSEAREENARRRLRALGRLPYALAETEAAIEDAEAGDPAVCEALVCGDLDLTTRMSAVRRDAGGPKATTPQDHQTYAVLARAFLNPCRAAAEEREERKEAREEQDDAVPLALLEQRLLRSLIAELERRRGISEAPVIRDAEWEEVVQPSNENRNPS